MICADCRAGAAVAAEAEVICQYLNGRPQEVLSGADAARNMHARCPEVARRKKNLTAAELAGSAWCACQHVVPVRSST